MAQTDWMIVRKVERDVAVPEQITAYRAAVVTETTRLETAILAATDVESLITTVSTQNWPQNP